MDRPVVDHDVATFIDLANTCKVLGALPRTGGLLEQDSYLIHGIQLVLNAQAEREQRDQEKASKKVKPHKAKRRR